MTERPNIRSDLAFRHPTEVDHAVVVGAVEAWWGERARAARPSRWWLRHAGSTCWLAEAPDGRLVGVALGLRSPDRVQEALLLVVAVAPAQRRTGVGRELVGRFAAGIPGATTVVAEAWPGNPGGIGFLTALGFRPDTGPGTQRLYGIPAWPDYDGPGEDRAVLRLELPLDT